MSNPATSLPPGFRFHPTDEELILHYLRNRAASYPCPVSIIAEVDIYKFDPWELPPQALFGDREWYFFSPRDRKYPNGIRPNRAAASGYWKATGTDKPIVTSKGNDNIGVKKALVFYKGRPPKGIKTDWIMHEYRLADAHNNNNNYKPNKLKDTSMRLDDWVLCRIYKKSNHQSVNSEHEDSCVDDVLITDHNTNTNTQEINPLRLPKVCSLTELLEAVDCSSALSRLFDNPPSMLGLDNCGTNYTSLSQLPMINSTNDIDNGQLMQHINQGESSTSVTENQLKRQRRFEDNFDDDVYVSHHAKKPIMVPSIFNSYTSHKFDGNQLSLLSQPFLNHQQVLLNSHLGLH